MIVIHLRRNVDGVIRLIEETGHWERRDTLYEDEQEDCHEFIWTDGNYACDCNRYLFFQRAAGEAEDAGRICGDGAYSIVQVVEDGVPLKLDYPL